MTIIASDSNNLMHKLFRTRCLPERLSAQALLLWIILACLSIPSRVATVSDPHDLDTRLLRTINNARSPFIGGIVNVVDYTVEPVGYSLPVLFMGTGVLVKDEDFFDTGFLMATAELTSVVLTQSLKRIVARARPSSWQQY